MLCGSLDRRGVGGRMNTCISMAAHMKLSQRYQLGILQNRIKSLKKRGHCLLYDSVQFIVTNKILMCSSKSNYFLNCSILGSLIILNPFLICGNSDIDGKSRIHGRDFLHFFLFFFKIIPSL